MTRSTASPISRRSGVNADVFEQDIGALRDGQEAKIEVNAYPGATFAGTVDFIYPTVSQETRTGKVRIVIRNSDGRLRWAFVNLKKRAAPGVDEVTWDQYAENLEANLADLHARVHAGTYRALPSRRKYIPKADGSQRPLGIHLRCAIPCRSWGIGITE